MTGSPEDNKTKARALKILGSRVMSSAKLEQRLIEKGEDADNVRETIEDFEKLGILNDTGYAAMIVENYTAKGYGISRIKDEFYKRGIPRELWDEALAKMSETDTEDAAYEILTKKLRGSFDKDDIRRAAGALYRRGFTSGEVNAAVSRYRENGDDTDI